MQKSVLGMGNALVDLLVTLPSDQVLLELNLPKGSMQLVDNEISMKVRIETSSLPKSMSSGGSAANTIHGLANLGMPTGFFGKTGNDEHGKFFEMEMHETGIQPSLLKSETPTGLAVALISPDSERTFATFLGAAIELHSNEVDEKIFAGFSVLHIEGYLVQNQELISASVLKARNAGLKISLDLASYNVVEANLEFLQQMLPMVDILFANEEEARSFTGCESNEALEILSAKCPLVIVKTGAKGSLVASGNQRVSVPANPVKAIDTTGAGDLYASGFLYGYLNGDSLETCARVGTFLASKVIEIIGAKISATDWNEIRDEVSRIRQS
jgi:sugar/nucleoside kinase (ribokinase family)